MTSDPTTTAACRECGVEADACCADLGYPCCWFCTVTRVAHMPNRQEAPEWTIWLRLTLERARDMNGIDIDRCFRWFERLLRTGR